MRSSSLAAARPGRAPSGARAFIGGFARADAVNALLVGLVCLWLACAVLAPLGVLLAKSLTGADDAYVGLANFRRFFGDPALSSALWNSISVSAWTTVLSVTLGFGYAYGLTRTGIRGKGFLRAVAMAPLFAPTLLNGIVLIYLFGRKGLVTTGFFGWFEEALGLPLSFDLGLYGKTGIILAETLYAFPQAVLILSVALRLTDSRLYEAAQSLGASKWRVFRTVTLPGVKYGLFSSVFVCFILCFTDFGAPKVVGGNYSVLATDIYKHVIGQQNFAMGATVSVVLLLPTLAAFVADRVIQRRQQATMAAQAVPYAPPQDPRRDLFFQCFCGLLAGLVMAAFGTAVFASLARVWPYDLSLTLAHYDFTRMGGGGYAAFWNSVRMAAWSAVAGTALTFVPAYLVEKTRGVRSLRRAAYFLSLVPLALPGLVIGLAYIFFFNAPGWDLPGGLHLPNPFGGLYGTMALLVLSNIVHFYSVSFLTATTALKQLDREYEAVSESLSAPRVKLFWRVTARICLPAILEIGLYFFVNAMATVSAVIFLYSADIPLASVAVANMDDAGDTASAAAMSVLIVLANVVVRLGYGLATSGLKRGSQAWLRRDG